MENDIDKQTGLKKISASKVKTFSRCPLQYWFSYVRGLKKPIRVNAVLGSACHKGLEENWKYKSISFKDLKIKTVLEHFDTAFEERFKKEEVEMGDSPKGVIKDDGCRLLTEYHKNYAPPIQPDAQFVERYFRIPFKNVPYILVGKIDMADVNKLLREYKTGRSKKGMGELASNIQLPIYMLGYKQVSGVVPKGFVVEQLTMLKTKINITQEVVPPEMMWSQKAVAMMLKSVNAAMEKNAFFPSNNPRICSWCGFIDECRKGDW